MNWLQSSLRHIAIRYADKNEIMEEPMNANEYNINSS